MIFQKTLWNVVSTAFLGLVLITSTATSAELTIGSKAPSLDIETWISDGNGFFDEVTDFEAGKVYVVEFWGTFCVPCIDGMPEFAELQQKFRGRDVQIVAVTVEDLETVENFLAKKHPVDGRTMGEITSAYSLTADPDGSVFLDYQKAAGETGIPTAYIVGKTGQIEWIGHTALLEEPLEKVVEDSWDRTEFAIEYNAQKRTQALGEELNELLGNGKVEEALALLDQEITTTNHLPTKDLLSKVRLEILFDTNQINDEVMAFYRTKLEAAKQDANKMADLAISLLRSYRKGIEVGEYGVEVETAFAKSIPELNQEKFAAAYQLLASLRIERKDIDGAIEAQSLAVENATDRAKVRLSSQLEQMIQLKAKLEGR